MKRSVNHLFKKSGGENENISFKTKARARDVQEDVRCPRARVELAVGVPKPGYA